MEYNLTMDRRQLLKLFGIGATAVPVVRGLPLMEAESLIKEPPKIELATPDVLQRLHAGGRCQMMLVLRRPDGKTETINQVTGTIFNINRFRDDFATLILRHSNPRA